MKSIELQSSFKREAVGPYCVNLQVREYHGRVRVSQPRPSPQQCFVLQTVPKGCCRQVVVNGCKTYLEVRNAVALLCFIPPQLVGHALRLVAQPILMKMEHDLETRAQPNREREREREGAGACITTISLGATTTRSIRVQRGAREASHPVFFRPASASTIYTHVWRKPR